MLKNILNHFRWILIDESGKHYKLGLYHGKDKGHLLVYCNFKIILIDFNVLSSRKYAFFLGHEFCELRLDRKNDEFQYSLKRDLDTDTPLNQIRKKKEKNYLIVSALLTISLFIIVFLLIWFFANPY